MDMNVVDKTVVQRELSDLETYLRQVREFSGTAMDTYRTDRKIQWTVMCKLLLNIGVALLISSCASTFPPAWGDLRESDGGCPNLNGRFENRGESDYLDDPRYPPVSELRLSDVFWMPGFPGYSATEFSLEQSSTDSIVIIAWENNVRIGEAKLLSQNNDASCARGGILVDRKSEYSFTGEGPFILAVYGVNNRYLHRGLDGSLIVEISSPGVLCMTGIPIPFRTPTHWVRFPVSQQHRD